MIFRRDQGKDTEPPKPAVTTPKVVIWHESPYSRFFYEEDLSEIKTYEVLRELQHRLQNLKGVQGVRIYRHYVALTWYHPATAEELEESVLSTLRRHFKWPAEPEAIGIMSSNHLRSLDHYYHGHESKWVLGQERYL